MVKELKKYINASTLGKIFTGFIYFVMLELVLLYFEGAGEFIYEAF